MNMLILAEGPTQGLDDMTLTAEAVNIILLILHNQIKDLH